MEHEGSSETDSRTKTEEKKLKFGLWISWPSSEQLEPEMNLIWAEGRVLDRQLLQAGVGWTPGGLGRWLVGGAHGGGMVK